MTFDDETNGFFDHLDDPTPPLHGGEEMTAVMGRGLQIRRRRRTAYALSSAAVVLVIAGSALAVATGGSPRNTGPNVIAGTPSSTATQTSTPRKSAHKGRSGAPGNVQQSSGTGGSSGGRKHHHSGGGSVVPPPVGPCTTTTTTPAPPVTPTATATSTDGAELPIVNETPQEPIVTTTCPTPTTGPTATAPPTDSSGQPSDDPAS